MQKRKLVVVLGMHRSGTSAITRGLKVMGVDLGDNLMPALKDNNDKGFWEDVELNKLNIDMLNALSSDWHHLTPVSNEDVKLLVDKGYHTRALGFLRNKVSDSAVFGMKDPRTAKLMPFWKGVFEQCGCEVSYLLIVRNPVSVVRSLTRLWGFHQEKSYMLWIDYTLTSLVESAGRKCLVVDYDNFMQSPVDELLRISEYFSCSIDQAGLEAYKIDFLDNRLRHSVFGLNELQSEPSCHPLAKEIYGAMLDVARNKASVSDLDPLAKKWNVEFERQVPLLMLADRVHQKLAQGEENMQRINLLNEQLNQVLLYREKQLEHLSHVVEERDRLRIILEEIYTSRSWKLTAPMRRLRELLFPSDKSPGIE